MEEEKKMRQAIEEAINELEIGFKFAKEYETHKDEGDYIGIKQQMMRAHKKLMEVL